MPAPMVKLIPSPTRAHRSIPLTRRGDVVTLVAHRSLEPREDQMRVAELVPQVPSLPGLGVGALEVATSADARDDPGSRPSVVWYHAGDPLEQRQMRRARLVQP